MHRRQVLHWLLTLVILLAVGYSGWLLFQPDLRFSLPSFGIADAHTEVVQEGPDSPVPTGLRPGDRIDLPALTPSTRIALIKSVNLNLIPNAAYDLAVRRAGTEGTPAVVTVHSVADSRESTVLGLLDWGLLGFLSYPFCLAVIALLTLWKGRGWDAMGLALWAIAFLVGIAMQLVPSDGAIGLAVLLGSNAVFLLARIGFYAMAEAMAAPLLAPRARKGWRVVFFIVLGLGALQSLAGPLAFVAYGWAELSRPAYGVTLTLSYAVPVAMLFAVLPRANATQRLRLGWVSRCGAIYVAAIFLINTPIFGTIASWLVARGAFSLSMVGLLYAVLRTRLLDFSVVLNRTLVYAATTSLILGVFALFESLIERIAVGERASLLLELLVPLALGASLTTVHRRIDGLIERLIFRRQYLQESMLRRFAHEAAFVSSPDSLKEHTVTELRRHIGAPWVALYEGGPQGFAMAKQCGEHALPARLDIDDPAVITLRAHAPDVDLHDREGALQNEGYAFPLQVRGLLLGLLVIASRPDEHYSSEERELFARVSHDVGAALFALRAQASELMLNEVRAQARASEERARASEALLLQLLPAAGTPVKT